MSSYYDDASLMLLASGGAQKDGKVYSIKPVPVYGAELVTNGDFATDSDWNKGSSTTISNGEASFNGALSYVYQDILTIGKTYACSVDVKNWTSGAALSVGSTATGAGTIYSSITRVSNTKTTFTFVAVSATLGIGSRSFPIIGSIDNVSVKEVLVADGDFTFTRGSNLAATRVGADGLIEKGRENLLKQSNQFDTTWATNNSSVTSGQADKDGGTDAWELKENTSTGVHEIIQSLSVSMGVQTYSLKVSANTRSKMALVLAGSAFNSGGNGVGIFNLTNGTLISSSGSLIDAKITSLGGNWYNVSITKLASSSSAVAVVQLVDDSNNTSYTGNGTGSIYIQDTQLELGLVATPYIETGASTAQAGILENTPRFDYSGGASCPSLLLEPSRSNLVPQSEYFGDWVLSGVSIALGSLDSPTGDTNAYVLTQTITGYGSVYKSLATTSGTTYTASVFAKAGTSNYLGLELRGSVNIDATFDLSDGTLTSGTGVIEDYGNGWYRCSITENISTSSALFLIGRGASGTAGDTTNLFGAQLEQGSYATSYIPTYGTSVTRAGELAIQDLSNEVSLTEGVVYIDTTNLATDNNSNIISQHSVANSVYCMRVYSSNKISMGLFASGVNVAITSASSYPLGTRTKIAFYYKSGDMRLYINGSLEGTNTSSFTLGSGFASALRLIEGSYAYNAYPSKSIVSEFILFPTALSDLDLKILTGATTYNTFAAMALALNYTVYE